MQNGTSTILDITTILPDLIEKTMESMTFSWYDYILFATMLLLSVIIGIYFGCFGTKQSTTKEYLMGGKQMKVIPIVISLVASHTSGITLLALPADVYKFGAAYWLGVISMFIVAIVTIYVFLPIFYGLEITSTYEYLERRFDNRTRQCASGLFALSLFVYLPIVTYIPALAFSAASGINVHYITPVVCGICIFYTTIGGLKAVVWTDTLQFTVTVGAMLAVFCLGLKSTGGIAEVWNKAVEGQRLDVFDFSPDPTKRETFWTIILGLTVHWIAHVSINQGCTQKFLSLPTFNKSKWSVILFCVGMNLVKTVSVLTGLIIYKKYSDCDPFTTKKVKNNDQLLPYYVLDVAGTLPGLSGLFIAGIFSAALSTLSANLNCLAGTIYEDFVVKYLDKHNKHHHASAILKLIVICTGVISTLMVYIVEHLGGLLSLAIGLGSVAHGPLLGMFTLGALFKCANSKGAFWGAISSTSVMTVIISGANYYKYRKFLAYPEKPISVEGCSDMFNSTILHFNQTLSQEPAWEPFFLFRISFYWYTMTGAIIGILVGLLISCLTADDDEKPDRHLISPVVRHLLADDSEDVSELGEKKYKYYSIEKAMDIVTVDREDMQ